MRTILIVVVCGLAVSGCAGTQKYNDATLNPASAQSMSVSSLGRTNPKLKGAIAVRSITGGKDTNPLIGGSQVDDASFKVALENSLASNGYLTSGKANCSLDANIQEIDNPFMGFEFKIKSVVTYRLSGCGQERTIPITAEGSASVEDKFVGSARLKIAKERSMQQNIKQFLEQLAN